MVFKNTKVRVMKNACPDLPDNYILLIAEKPKAAKAIANALAYKKPRQCINNGVPYWIIRENYQTIVIASTAGHMFGLATSKHGIPVYEYEWKPRWIVEKNARHIKKFYNTLQKLSRRASIYVNACDYDIEGSVIGYLIIKQLGDINKAKRMKYSTLTEEELRKAYQNLQPLDTPMIEAGLCRHELDWIWGINSSRALMKAYQTATKERIILSAGRVQTPTLIETVERYIGTQVHIKPPQFTLKAKIKANNKEFTATHKESPFNTKEQAKKAQEKTQTKRKGIVEKVIEKTQAIPNPPAFNLGDLQYEASRIYGFTPQKTQKIAENLYLNALISYPRTNSQKLPATINHNSIINNLEKIGYEKEARQIKLENPLLKPKQGRKDDPAHPAIYPTGKQPRNLNKEEKQLYDLIVRRYLAAFSREAIQKTKEATIILGEDQPYTAKGTTITNEGWLKIYPYKKTEKELPDLKEGQQVTLVKTQITIQIPPPPKPHNRTTLLKWMETNNIGTEATRAQIIETLFKRKYLITKGKTVKPTTLGIGVSSTIKKYFPQLASVKLTRSFEEKILMIRQGSTTRQETVQEAISTINEIIKQILDNVGKAGEELKQYIQPKPSRKCLLCNLPSENGLCIIHQKALENLLESLPDWMNRAQLSKKEALEKIAKTKTIGEAVREVAKAIIENKIIIE